MSTHPYASAILFATASFSITLLILPPMCWHYRNRNLGATLLVFWAALINFLNFLNAIIWSNDNLPNWYNGVGLCDLEVKIQEGWSIAGPAALLCVLRGLANAMDTNRATLIKTQAQKWRDWVFEMVCCVFFPLLQMLFHYIVQSARYYIFGIAGCVPAVSNTWLTVLLLHILPIVWTLADVCYAILILSRLYIYRLTFSALLSASNPSLTRTRFLRLYVFCLILLFAFVPLQSFVLYTNLIQGVSAYSWKEVHDPKTWNDIIMVPSRGHLPYFSYLWLGAGLCIFLFFGMGRDAISMYKATLITCGLGKLWPGLNKLEQKNMAGEAPTNSSWSKGKMTRLWSWRKGVSSFTGIVKGTLATTTTTVTATVSSEQDEGPEKPGETGGQPHTSAIGCIASWIWLTKSKDTDLALSSMNGRDTGSEHQERAASGSMDAAIIKLLHQNSETVGETLPARTYEGV